MNEKETKPQRIYDLLNADTKPTFLFLPYTKQRISFTEKELFKEMREWRIEQKNEKKAF